jgi:hypothetical protein
MQFFSLENKITDIPEIPFMRKFFTILIIAVVHSVVTKIISNITLIVVTANVHNAQMPLIGRLLMLISKIFYFPVITMAFYPRQFFPGNLIIIPLFINSLLWALIIYIVVVLIKKFVTSR